MKKLLSLVLGILLVTPVIVSAQFQQNQVTIAPYGGIPYATSTSGITRFGQLRGSALGDIISWNGSIWVTGATSTLGFENPLAFSSGLTRLVNAVTCDNGSASAKGCITTVDWTSFNSRLSTSSLALIDKGFFFSTTSENYYQQSSTTVPTTYKNNTFTGTNGFQNITSVGATSTSFFATVASSTSFWGGGLPGAGCTGTSFLQWSTGSFSCGTPPGTTYTGTFPIIVTGSVISTAFGTTTNTGLPANQFVYTNNSGVLITAASSSLSLPNAALQNSTISGIALGANLANLSVDSTLTGTAYNGNLARTFGINLASPNTWTALQIFSGGSSSSNATTTGTQYFSSLAGNAAGTLVAIDPSGKLIATTTTAGGVTAVTGTYPVISSGGATPAISLAFGTTTANTWSLLNIFTLASTTQLSVFDRAWFGGTATSSFNSTGLLDLFNQNATSSWVTLSGRQFLSGSSTAQNTFLGFDSGAKTTSGVANTAVGFQALQLASSSPGNTAIGTLALQGAGTGLIMSGGQNTAVGAFALASGTTATLNTAIGYAAGRTLTTGSQNTIIGNIAAATISGGSSNVVIGYGAGSNLRGDTTNVLVGNSAGSSIFNGSTGNNVFIGNNSGANGSAGIKTGNTSIGSSAGAALGVQANDNVLFGFSAGILQTTGTQNTLLGTLAGQTITTGSGNILIGYNALATSSSVGGFLNIGNSIFGTLPATTSATTINLPINNTLGVGTTSPWGKFSIQSNNGDLNTMLFVISSSTANSTTTLFSVDNTGAASTTKLFGSGLPGAGCAGSSFLQWNTTGLFACGTPVGGSSTDKWATTTDTTVITPNGSALVGIVVGAASSTIRGINSSVATSSVFRIPFSSSVWWDSHTLADGTLVFATSTSAFSQTFAMATSGSLCIGMECTAPPMTGGLVLRDQYNTGPYLFMGGNDGGDTDWELLRFANNDTVSNDRISIGTTASSSSRPAIEIMTWNPLRSGSVGVGSTTPWGKFSIVATSTEWANPILSISASSSDTGQLINLFATSSLLVSSTTGNTALNFDSIARLGIGPNLIFSQSGPLDQLAVDGRVNTGDWHEIDCYIYSVMPGSSLTADTSQVCGPWSFSEDTTASMGIGSNASGLTRLFPNTGSNGLLPAFSPAAEGAGLFLPSYNAFLTTTSTPIFEAGARILQSQFATTSIFVLGFVNKTTASSDLEIEPSRGCFFMASTSLANWQALCRTSITNTTVVDTGVASTTNSLGDSSYFKFRVEMTANFANFYMASTTAKGFRKVALIATNIPSSDPGGGATLSPDIFLGKTLAGNASGIDINYIRVWFYQPILNF